MKARAPSSRWPRPWLSRLVWFVMLWVAGVLAIGVLAYAIRLVLLP